MQLKMITVLALCMVYPIIAQPGHEPPDNDFLWDTFPDDFLWGTASSAYQIEGAWDVQGKGPNIWDTWTHQGQLPNNETGDDACLSYYKYNEDVKLVKDLGAQFYRFSLSWSRLMPDGTGNKINQAGIDYYNNIIKELSKHGILPMVTLYHWDLPQALQDIGGWENEALIDHFKNYADLCYKEFGDRVKNWITFNNPWLIAWYGYGKGHWPPGVKNPGIGEYKTGHVIIRAHVEAWHLYNDRYRATQKGKVGIAFRAVHSEPLNPEDPADVAAALRDLQCSVGWFAHPIFKTGDYPDVMKDLIRTKSQAAGLSQSRLPEFTEEEKKRNLGTSDFFGINHFSTHYTTSDSKPSGNPSYATDMDIKTSVDPSWPKTASPWLKVVPWGIRKILNYVKDEYDNPVIYITANGFSDNSVNLQDNDRIDFFKNLINNVLKARVRDGVNVQAYTSWTLMDNFEWSTGYEVKFGMYYVNFSDPERPRTAKASARYYSKIIKDNGFVEPSASSSPLGISVVLVAISSITIFFM